MQSLIDSSPLKNGEEQSLKDEINAIGDAVITETVTLASLMRAGSVVTEQAIGSFGDAKRTACALTAAVIGARQRNLL